MPYSRLAVVMHLAVFGLAFSASASQWPVDDTSDVSVSSAFNRQQDPVATSDGAGGAIVAWQDLRDELSWNIWAQRISVHGEALWTVDGVVVCDDLANQTAPRIVSDGAGGAIVVWQEDRNLGLDIYAQRIDAGGNTLWAANGVSVTAFPDNQIEYEAIADGQGGVIIAWADLRTGVTDIYAQRLDASGVPLWTADGVLVCGATGSQNFPVLASDSAGGAVIGWEDLRGADLDIYVQRLDAGGSPLWAADGIPVVTFAGDQENPDIAPSLNNGAIIVWDGPGWTNEAGIFGQRLGADGSSEWGAGDGSPIATSDVNAITRPVIIPDGEYGAIVAYELNPLFGTNEDIHMVRVGPYSSSALWDIQVLNGFDDGNPEYRLASDGAAGAVLAWTDYRNGNGNDDIYAQRIDANGNEAWESNGQPVSRAAGDQLHPLLVADGLGGAVFVWQDDANGPIDLNVRAHRIERWGHSGYPSPEITTIEDVPQDDGRQVLLSWSRSYLDVFPESEVSSYSVWRKWLGSGAKSGIDPRRLADLGPDKAGWSFVASQDAQWLDEYSLVVPTYADSTGAGLSQTAFLVIAETGVAIRFWSSLPDSGYSVDNLVPSAPLSLTGELVGPDAQLAWDLPEQNAADIVAYRLYGSGAPGVVPGPGTLLVTTPDLDWLDTTLGGQGRYYVVTAVDDAENESPPSNEVHVGAVASVDGPPGAVARLTLFGAAPNPFNPSTEIVFALPADGGRVQLEVLRVDGTRIRRLLDRNLPAGPHSATWRGRDDAGREMPSGVYLARLRLDGETRVRKMSLVR